ncbi:MAG: HlyC/CorC family transporter [Parcubacteria group bacterium]|nr:HlyC/CorC family transporter [Parcubacteria group bacterium]
MKFILFFILLALAAFFSSAETAYFSIRPSQIRLMREKKKKGADLAHRLKKEPERLLITILIGNNIAQFSAASIATVLGFEYFGSLGAGIATGLITFVSLVFGDIIPKTTAIARNTALVRRYSKPLYFFFVLFYPLVWFLLKLQNALSEFLNIKHQAIVSEEEIRVMSRLGAEHGAIEYSEHEMIENVFKFDDVKVGSIMTPTAKMEALQADVPIDNVAHFVSVSGYSRFPVEEDGRFIGYIHVNQIMRALNSDERDEPLRKFISPIKSVSENTIVEKVFRSMQKSKSHMYLVHAENDTEEIVGLVTMENVLEEIVGEIKDETDD